MSASSVQTVNEPAAKQRSVSEEAQLRVLSLLRADPELSQRELAEKLGISLGKTNYVLKGLVEKGWVKAQNFRNSRNKWAYVYRLTPAGLEEKARITLRYLERRMAEFEALKAELMQLRRDLAGGQAAVDTPELSLKEPSS